MGKIELAELVDWLNNEEVTFARSTRERKRLSANFRGCLTITVAGRIVWQGIQPFVAVKEYNKITEKYEEEKFKL